MQIKIINNGPYVVDGDIPIKEVTTLFGEKGAAVDYAEGKTFEPTAQKKFICRCGRSKNMPFCDGSHINNFEGAETDNRKNYDDEAELIKGERCSYLNNEKLCSYSGFCVNGYDYEAAAGKCDSGCMVLVDGDGNKIETALPKEIFIVANESATGPAFVRGGIQITSGDGFNYEIRNRVTLCRCGKSKNKPFCDGSHKH